MEQKITDLDENNNKAHEDISRKIDAFGLKIDKWVEGADKKFAPKWVADAMKFVIATVFGAILLLLIAVLADNQ